MSKTFRKLAVMLALAGGSLVYSQASRAGTLLGYYQLNGNLNDSSGNGNNATAGPTAPTYGTGVSGQGALFSGSDPSQYFTIPINLNSYAQVTFGAWIHVADNTPYRGIISNDAGAYGRTIDIDDINNNIGYGAYNGVNAFGGITPSVNGFDFVAVTYDRTASTETLDVNGTFYSSTGTPPDGDPFITVGRNPHFNELFNGTLDNLFVYSGVLSQESLDGIETNGVIPTPGAPDVVPVPAAVYPSLMVLGGLAATQMIRRKKLALA